MSVYTYVYPDRFIILQVTSMHALFSICIQSYTCIVAIYVITAAKQKLLACALSVTHSGLYPVFLMLCGGCRDMPPVPLGDRYTYPYPNTQSLSLPSFAFQSSLLMQISCQCFDTHSWQWKFTQSDSFLQLQLSQASIWLAVK